MSLKDSIKADATDVFLKTSEFAELVTYLPRNGGRRVIRAIVDRSPPAVYNAAGDGVVLPSYVITVCNCCRTGVSSAEVDTGDAVELLENLNERIKDTKTVMKIINHDEGMVELALVGKKWRQA